jgi:hypothetical protein
VADDKIREVLTISASKVLIVLGNMPQPYVDIFNIVLVAVTYPFEPTAKTVLAGTTMLFVENMKMFLKNMVSVSKDTRLDSDILLP